MAFEKRLEQTALQSFTMDGTVLGKITIPKPWLFKTRELVVLASLTQDAIEVQVKRVEDTVLFVGPIDNKLDTRLDISAYTAVDGATIYAPEQTRPQLQADENYDTDDLEHAEEPTNAKRVALVDEPGHYIDSAVISGKRRIAVAVQEPLSVTTSGGAGGLSVPDISNTVVAANSETPIALPAGTRRFTIQARGNSLLRLAFTGGGTGTLYLTIGRGSSYTEDGLDPTASFTLRVLADDIDTIEVLSWS